MDRIAEQVRTYIADNILFREDGYPYTDDASFMENGIIDSMNLMELVMFVEETFAIGVRDDEIVPEHFDSVAKMAAYIAQKTLAANPSLPLTGHSSDGSGY